VITGVVHSLCHVITGVVHSLCHVITGVVHSLCHVITGVCHVITGVCHVITGVVLLECFYSLSSVSSLRGASSIMALLSICTSAAILVEVGLQTVFILDALRRAVHTHSQQRYRLQWCVHVCVCACVSVCVCVCVGGGA